MAIARKKKCESRELKTVDIELAVANYFCTRRNLIVPGVHWGLFIHECDLLVISKAGYAREVEIKISKADLVKDKEKRHGHIDHRIKELWFAMPKFLQPAVEHVPERAGIILVDAERMCHVLREARAKKHGYKFTEQEQYQVARLGALRIWALKRKVRELEKAGQK